MTGSHVHINRDYWNGMADDWVAMGERAWASDPSWGIWGIAEADLALVPINMTGQAAIELGCGTGYWSAWMHRRGAVATGIDISAEQLATARRLAEKGIRSGTMVGDLTFAAELLENEFTFVACSTEAMALAKAMDGIVSTMRGLIN